MDRSDQDAEQNQGPSTQNLGWMEMREERAREEGQRTEARTEARTERQREIDISRQSLMQVDRTGTVCREGKLASTQPGLRERE